MNDQTVIQASRLVKRYKQVEAVRGIDLEVRATEIFGFLGPNGALVLIAFGVGALSFAAVNFRRRD